MVFVMSFLYSPLFHSSFWEAWPTSASARHIRAWIRLWDDFDGGGGKRSSLNASHVAFDLDRKSFEWSTSIQIYSIFNGELWQRQDDKTILCHGKWVNCASWECTLNTEFSQFHNPWHFLFHWLIENSSTDIIWVSFITRCSIMWIIADNFSILNASSMMERWTRTESSLFPPSFCILLAHRLYSTPEDLI